MHKPQQQNTDRATEPASMVIFGASGDLTMRKLVPALYDLFSEGRLPQPFLIVGAARRPMSADEFRQRMQDAICKYSRAGDSADWSRFAENLHYQQLDYPNAEDYGRLREQLEQLEKERGMRGNRVYYLAVPPSSYKTIAANLGESCMATEQEGFWRRLIVEKPFGRDLDTARELNVEILRSFQEHQVYRIDHYLGKETVQNLLVFRFANGIFEPVWNRTYVDHVQITVTEQLGVEGRGGYYEEAGAMRDMVQNHLLQLLCLVGMEPPVRLNAEAVRDEKAKVLAAIRPYSPDEIDKWTARGQYGPGVVGGDQVPGYRQEPGVAPDSNVETYAAVELRLDNWRFADVPFYLRAGKRMPRRLTEIAIQFKCAPHLLFQGSARSRIEPNRLVIRIQPDEGISLRFGVKAPGPGIRIHAHEMDFDYGSAFGTEPPEAYERLLLDCLRGDPTLFARADWVEAAWEIVTPILQRWEETPPGDFPNYPAGTWGPTCADQLLENEGNTWRRP